MHTGATMQMCDLCTNRNESGLHVFVPVFLFHWEISHQSCRGWVQQELGVIYTRIWRQWFSPYESNVVKFYISARSLVGKPCSHNFCSAFQCTCTCKRSLITHLRGRWKNDICVRYKWKYTVKVSVFVLCESSWEEVQRYIMFLDHIQWIPESHCKSKRKRAKSQDNSDDILFSSPLQWCDNKLSLNKSNRKSHSISMSFRSSVFMPCYCATPQHLEGISSAALVAVSFTHLMFVSVERGQLLTLSESSAVVSHQTVVPMMTIKTFSLHVFAPH